MANKVSEQIGANISFACKNNANQDYEYSKDLWVVKSQVQALITALNTVKGDNAGVEDYAKSVEQINNVLQAIAKRDKFTIRKEFTFVYSYTEKVSEESPDKDKNGNPVFIHLYSEQKDYTIILDHLITNVKEYAARAITCKSKIITGNKGNSGKGRKSKGVNIDVL